MEVSLYDEYATSHERSQDLDHIRQKFKETNHLYQYHVLGFSLTSDTLI